MEEKKKELLNNQRINQENLLYSARCSLKRWYLLSHSVNIGACMGPEDSVPCPQEPTIELHLEPGEFSPSSNTLSP